MAVGLSLHCYKVENMKFSTYFKKASFTGLAKSIGSALITVIFIPLIIHRIGMENYGVWMLLAVFMGISAVADLGLTKSIVYFIPRQKLQEDINEVYSAGIFVNGFMILLVAVIGLIVYWSGINIWGTNNAVSYELGRLLFVCGLVVACSTLVISLYQSVLEAFFKIHIVNIGFFLLTALNYIFVYLLSFFTTKPEHFVIATSTIYVFIVFLHWAAVRAKTTASLHVPKWETIHMVVKYAFGFFAVGVPWTITYTINRYLVVALGGSAASYGIFDIALKIAFFAMTFLQAFVAPLFSAFVNYGEKRIHEIQYILKRSLPGLGGAYVLGCFLFFIFGERILALLLKNSTSELFSTSFVLILGIAFFAVADPFYRAFLALGRLKLMFMLSLIQPIVNILGFVVLADFDPLFRVSLAFSLSWAITALAHMIMFRLAYPYQHNKATILDFSL